MMRAATARAFEWPPGELEAFTTVTSAPKAALASSLYYRQFLTRELSGVRRGGGDRADGDRLEMPVLQLVGTEDVVLRRVAPPPAAAAGWRLEVVPGCGHFLFDEQPDFALARTRAFLVGG
jgi:pimeloyl-ACP methyl ester carboxylesterase